MRSLRVLFVYQFLTLGGVEAVILSRLKNLESRGIETRVFFLHDLGGRSIFKGFESRIFVSADPSKLAEYVHEFQPTHIVSFDTPQIVPILDRLDLKCIFIYEVHTIYDESFLPLKDKALTERVDAYFVPSKYQQQIVQKILGNRTPVYIVPNGLQEGFLRHEESTSSISQYPIILWVGRLDHIKNWKGFLSTCRLLAMEREDLHYWFVGGLNSPHETHYQLWLNMKKNDLAKNFHWFPAVDHHEMPAVYQYVAASGGCMLSTSRRESFGVAVLEGMACGCPVVVPKIGALVDLVRHAETGLMYPPANYKAASQEILKLLRGQRFHKKIADQGMAFSRRFSPEQVLNQFMETLSNLSA